MLIPPCGPIGTSRLKKRVGILGGEFLFDVSRILLRFFVLVVWSHVSSVGGGGAKSQDADVIEPPETACIAVAGPVSDNRVVMTNRAWVIDGAEVG